MTPRRPVTTHPHAAANIAFMAVAAVACSQHSAFGDDTRGNIDGSADAGSLDVDAADAAEVQEGAPELQPVCVARCVTPTDCCKGSQAEGGDKPAASCVATAHEWSCQGGACIRKPVPCDMALCNAGLPDAQWPLGAGCIVYGPAQGRCAPRCSADADCCEGVCYATKPELHCIEACTGLFRCIDGLCSEANCESAACDRWQRPPFHSGRGGKCTPRGCQRNCAVNMDCCRFDPKRNPWMCAEELMDDHCVDGACVPRPCSTLSCDFASMSVNYKRGRTCMVVK